MDVLFDTSKLPGLQIATDNDFIINDGILAK